MVKTYAANLASDLREIRCDSGYGKSHAFAIGVAKTQQAQLVSRACIRWRL
jgi:hypothetical protein